MKHYRYYQITKYDTEKYDKNCYAEQDEWTCIWDEAKEIDGVWRPTKEYVDIEEQYIKAIFHVLKVNQIDGLAVKGLSRVNYEYHEYSDMDTEKTKGFILSLEEDMVLSGWELALTIKLILRDNMWCSLEAEDFYLHFSNDLYMYLICLEEIKEAELKKTAPKMYVRERISWIMLQMWEDMGRFEEFYDLYLGREDEELYKWFKEALQTFAPEIYVDLPYDDEDTELTEEDIQAGLETTSFLDAEREKGNYTTDQEGYQAVDVLRADGARLKGQYDPKSKEWITFGSFEKRSKKDSVLVTVSYIVSTENEAFWEKGRVRSEIADNFKERFPKKAKFSDLVFGERLCLSHYQLGLPNSNSLQCPSCDRWMSDKSKPRSFSQLLDTKLYNGILYCASCAWELELDYQQKK